MIHAIFLDADTAVTYHSPGFPHFFFQNLCPTIGLAIDDNLEKTKQLSWFSSCLITTKSSENPRKTKHFTT